MSTAVSKRLLNFDASLYTAVASSESDGGVCVGCARHYLGCEAVLVWRSDSISNEIVSKSEAPRLALETFSRVGREAVVGCL